MTGRSVGRRFFTFWPRRRIVGSEPEGSPRARVRSEMAMFEYPVKIQATAAIPERRRGRETRARDSNATVVLTRLINDGVCARRVGVAR